MNVAAAVSRRITSLGRRGWRRIRRGLLMSSQQRAQDRAARAKLLPLVDESILNAFAPGIIELGNRMQQDDRPVVVGPWVSELGFEVLYWVPFVKWFVERFNIAPRRLIFVSRGGMGAWYDRAAWDGAPRYVDLLSMMSPDAYRQQNANRWQRSGGQKQPDTDRFETDILRQVTGQPSLAAHHLLHPGAMYNFFRVCWTHHRRLSIGVDAVMRHTCFEPLQRLPPWTGVALPASFVAVKFYDRPTFQRTPETVAGTERLLRQIAESRPVISLDTAFETDEHATFPLPRHPNIVSARDWMLPATNLHSQTQLLAAADCFIGTYGGTAYMPPFVDTPSFGLYVEDGNLNFVHQLVAMRASQILGRGVTLLSLADCGLFADVIAGNSGAN